ncbi:right-handed parallel beta-helix repeat-containing protein [Chitinophaga ginsengisegetis]|uniref:right-handed parallel beta-helix repeat-containing protein n=1 Tax=Chitinophaga ginsengisegetis TaxID=393003 RepID=UPI000DB9587A|nr:right-handed parallel beta-helix repeat-containing protein [Chitinophaga ginsengisegetis]MDR6570056.1 hypothetical protein [Chitinophaga ginsengisegetis]MDR6649790.1 hypothetical protein [Chitinophaga ginsengisegetis]MDR6656007.1 hypothetical protein [Chitinophaga ginsengisegetis]
MNIRKVFQSVVLFAMIVSLPAVAAIPRTYYIDALTGKDTNNGLSEQQPWRSLQQVNNHVFEPGDQIRFRAGRIYEGQLKPQGSGHAQQLITIDQYGDGYKPRIQGNGVMPATLYLLNAEGWEIRNLDISNYGADVKAHRAGVQVQLSDYGIASNIYLKNIDVHDVNGSLVKNDGGGAGIIFSNGGRHTRSKFDSILVADCTIKRCQRNGILVNGNWSRTDWFPNEHVVIRGNLIEGVPGDGIVPTGCDGVLVEHNIMRDCPRLLPDTESAAGIWPWSCDNALIQYNEVSDHKAPWDGQGFDSDWNCNNTVIQYNYSHDNDGGFVLVCNDGSAGASQSCGNKGTIIRYNVSMNDGLRTTGKHAGFAPVFHITGPVVNTRIYNNVIYLPERDIKMDSTLVEMGNWFGYADSTWFANNIFYTRSTADYIMNKSKRNIYSNNLYFGTHLNRPADKTAVTKDPQFQAAPLTGMPGMEALEVFRLQPGSPALKKGAALPDKIATDLYGTPLSLPPNIGVDGK